MKHAFDHDRACRICGSHLRRIGDADFRFSDQTTGPFVPKTLFSRVDHGLDPGPGYAEDVCRSKVEERGGREIVTDYTIRAWAFKWECERCNTEFCDGHTTRVRHEDIRNDDPAAVRETIDAALFPPERTRS